MEKNFYVYVYTDPFKKGNYKFKKYFFNYEPFYVGKGKGKRYYYHLYKSSLNKSGKYKNNKLKLILESIEKEKFKKKFIIFIKKNISEKEAIKLEIDLIKNIGRRIDNKGPLTNITSGGEGWGIPWNKGLKCPSIGRKGKIPWNKGKKNIYSEETKNKISAARKGKKHSKKTKEKIGKTRKEQLTLKFSKEIKNKIIKLYNLGYTQKELIVEFNKLTKYNIKTRHVINRILNEKNIKKRTTTETKLLRNKDEI